jgi:hypothetical protein
MKELNGRMTMKTLMSLAILTSLFASPVYADLIAPESGTVQITVLDANGQVVKDAPVYIYGEHKTKFVGGADVAGSTTFEMKEGTYRISSALIKREGDNIDRFASNEAHVSVVAGDNMNIVLTLKALDTPADQLPTSYGTLHMAGIPGNYLNNN